MPFAEHQEVKAPSGLCSIQQVKVRISVLRAFGIPAPTPDESGDIYGTQLTCYSSAKNRRDLAATVNVLCALLPVRVKPN